MFCLEHFCQSFEGIQNTVSRARYQLISLDGPNHGIFKISGEILREPLLSEFEMLPGKLSCHRPYAASVPLLDRSLDKLGYLGRFLGQQPRLHAGTFKIYSLKVEMTDTGVLRISFTQQV